MNIFKKIFSSKPLKTQIPNFQMEAIVAFYERIPIEEIALYQIHFDKIINKLDVSNYTKWSKSKKYDRIKLGEEDKWMYEMLVKAEGDGINGALLQNMINQYFFADIFQREIDKKWWVQRVVYGKYTDYFPNAQRMRNILELLQ